MVKIILESLFAIVSIFALYPTYAIADSPEEFLLNIVKSDFKGDPEYRGKRVTFSRKSAQAAYEKALELPDIRPEYYSLDLDPLKIVTDWEVIEQRSFSSKKFCMDVRFTLVAYSIGRGLPPWFSKNTRKFVSLDRPILETVRYCAVEINNQWMLVDPPIPRVEKVIVVRFFQEKLKDAMHQIDIVKTNRPLGIKNMAVIIASFADQLASLGASAN
ncbi:hypothetical protein ACO0K2_01395 [Undibacterium sp. MH2W]|uniref:hypothetical protein n=1 Tax=Undibacterium sp. MH2W TaxID=3413044 RepID=UPI003BF15402